MSAAETASGLGAAFRRVRRQTTELVAPLAIEDYGAQSLPDARPAKWHVGHTSWYFETFVLAARGAPGREGAGRPPIRPEYREIFGVSDAGAPQTGEVPRDRGVLSRPTVAEVFDYRRRVDEAMAELLADELPDEARILVVLGLHHEQQHQERLLADLKHLFSRNPLFPAYREAPARSGGDGLPPLRFVAFAGGVRPIGHRGAGFAYDNERPRHERLIEPFQLGSRLITNGEYLEFIEEGGYRERSLWLADGWDARAAGGWEAPLHWVRQGDGFAEFTLGGVEALASDAPVVHVSYFEADAFARWREARLPTEFEWETPAAGRPVEGTFLENGRLHPAAIATTADGPGAAGPAQLFGDVWEWTGSPYLPYPGFRPSGRFGQSSGRSMSGRMVLRGGSCFTPASHIRASYRHVLRPDARWQATGIRLARDG